MERFDRREFLGTLAAGSAALAAGRGWAAEAAGGDGKRPWTMRLSTSTVQFPKLPLAEACARIARAGYKGIDIWSSFGSCHHLDGAVEKTPPEELKALLAKHGLGLNAFSIYLDYEANWKKYIEYLGKVGGGVVVFGSGPAAKPGELAARIDRLQESLKPILEAAEKADARIAVENHGDSLLNGIDTMKAFVDRNRSARLGIALAPYHLQAGKMSVEEAIGTCGRSLFFFYAWQHAPDWGQLPGHGPTDFTPWIGALAGIRYAGWVNPFLHGEMEPDEVEKALVKSRKYLEERAAKATAR